jgi:hypothetical protein
MNTMPNQGASLGENFSDMRRVEWFGRFQGHVFPSEVFSEVPVVTLVVSASPVPICAADHEKGLSPAV